MEHYRKSSWFSIATFSLILNFGYIEHGLKACAIWRSYWLSECMYRQKSNDIVTWNKCLFTHMVHTTGTGFTHLPICWNSCKPFPIRRKAHICRHTLTLKHHHKIIMLVDNHCPTTYNLYLVNWHNLCKKQNSKTLTCYFLIQAKTF